MALCINGRAGAGATAEVIRVSLDDGCDVAVKIAKDRSAWPLLKHEDEVCRDLARKGCAGLVAHSYGIKIFQPDAGFDSTSSVAKLSGNPCLIMSWVEGKSMWDILREVGVMSVERALLFSYESFGLGSAIHRAGYLMRDPNPGNVMLCPDGHLRLVDYGFVVQQGKANDGLLFTNGLEPPEARGEAPWGWTAASDVYTLGQMTCWSLYGQKASPETVHASHFGGGINDDFQGWLCKCIAEDPGERWSDCSVAWSSLCQLGNRGSAVGSYLRNAGRRVSRLNSGPQNLIMTTTNVMV